MKKFLFSFLSLSLVLSLICSCNGKSGFSSDASDSISFDSIKTDSTLFITEDTAGPRCHINLSIVYAKGKNAENINDSIIRSGILSPDYLSLSSEKISIPQAVDSFVSRYMAEYKKVYTELYKADKGHGSFYVCEYDVRTQVTQENDKYYTYQANIYNYGGGAHGNSIVVVKNIDVETGKIITLKDLFVPGFEHELNGLIVKNLCEKFDAKDLKELNDKAVFMGIDVYPSENFIVGKKSITFIYSPDEIAFHAAGEIRVEINNSDIENLLKKQK